MLQYHKDEHGYWIVSDEMVGKYGPFHGVFIAHQSRGDFPAECLPQEMQTYRYAYGALDSEIFQISEGGLEEILAI